MNPHVLLTLHILYDKIHDLPWILTGSTSLAIQGVDVPIGDIDILTDPETINTIDELLSDFRIKPPTYSTADRYQSYLGIYRINDIKVEVMADFQYKTRTGWSEPHRLDRAVPFEYDGMTIRLIPLEQELKEYEATGRTDKVERIREAIDRKPFP